MRLARNWLTQAIWGGSGYDGAWSPNIAVDDAGNAYLAGGTTSSDFPVTPDALQGNFGGGEDVFVTKIDTAASSSASSLVYSTYLGGSGNDFGYDVAIDDCSNIYFSGDTGSTDFPITANAFQTTNAGGRDAFVAKLNASGSALVFSSYLGGSGNESGVIAVDASGNTYVGGWTNSRNFPTVDPIQPEYAGGPGWGDAFVTQVDPAGSQILFSTYLGGTNDDPAWDITADDVGNVYVVGSTESGDFPTVNPYQDYNAGGGDAFVAKIRVNLAPNIDEPLPAPTVNENSDVTLSATAHDSDSDDLTFTWNWGDGTAGTVTVYLNESDVNDTVSHTYADNGVYTVALTVEDDDGGVGTATTNVTVNNLPPEANISGPNKVLKGEAVTYILRAMDPSSVDQVAGFDYSIDWDGDGMVDQTVNGADGTPVNHTFNTAETTTVRLTATDKDGGVSEEVAFQVDIIQPVDVDVKPGNSQNKVNVKSQGVIPVAVYTTADFDAQTVDASTVRLVGVSANHFAWEDVDDDGDLDLILHFRTQDILNVLDLDLKAGESEQLAVSLTGETVDEVLLQGFDTIEFFMPGNDKGSKKQ